MIRPGFIVALIALAGFTLSGVAALRSYSQEKTIERAALERAVVTHAQLVQERLSERELLSRVAVGMFRPASVVGADALLPLQSSIYTFKTDFVLASWIARVSPDDFSRANESLAASGFHDSKLRHQNDSPLDLAAANGPLDIVLDVEPRTSQTEAIAGRAIDASSSLGNALKMAAASSKPVSTEPIKLLAGGGPLGIILVTPAFLGAGDSQPIGFISFSYSLAPLLASDAAAPFVLSLRDPRNADIDLTVGGDGKMVETKRVEPSIADDTPLLMQNVDFGGRTWQLSFVSKENLSERPFAIAAISALIGIIMTATVCALFGYVAFSNVRLQREIDARLSYEQRLSAVIGELNHRVKNILAVIQSIVTRTLRPGADIDHARDLLIGRIHAMSQVVSLLSESQWQGVKLRSLLQSRSIPNFEHAVVSGPDILVSSRAAQSLSLLFFELASHGVGETDSDAALSPSIVVQWQVDSEAKNAVFHLRWEEFNASPLKRREESDFGTILLDRVAPEAVGGTSKRYFTDVSYVYELTAPMESVVDRTELDRTMRFAVPSPPPPPA